MNDKRLEMRFDVIRIKNVKLNMSIPRFDRDGVSKKMRV